MNLKFAQNSQYLCTELHVAQSNEQFNERAGSAQALSVQISKIVWQIERQFNWLRAVL